MGDDITASIKRTQDSLGKFVKKPPLSDKNLTRPPFRFLHDLVHNVIDTTGFMSGVFTPEELDVANVTTREAKTAFMQKVIETVKEKSGEDVPIKISKILAGLEAEKTNSLLQALAKAIETHQQEGGGAPKKGSGGTSKKPAAGAQNKKPGAGDSKTKADAKKGAAAKVAVEKKDGGSGGTKRTIRDASPGGKPATKQGKTQETPSSGGKGKTKPVKPSPSAAPPPEPTVPESQVNDETGGGVPEVPAEEEAPPPQRAATARKLQRQPSTADMAKPKGEPEEDVDLDAQNANSIGANNNTSDSANPPNLNNGNVSNFDPISATLLPSPTNPNMQTLPPPTTPILTDADAVIATMTPPPGPTTPIKSFQNSLTPTPGPSLTPSPMLGLGGKGPRSLSREASATSIGEVRPPTGQQVRSRPDTGTGGRLTSARPPSARRAPPRPKSSVVREDAEPYRPQTGKVAHVILDTAEDQEDDDDNYVVREVTVQASKAPGLSDLDETPELGGGMPGILGGGGGGNMDLGLDGEKGLLVHQILETQKELEDKAGGLKGEEGKMEKKLKELSLAEIDKLKNLIQVCSRSANPLAKLLDYMAEDVDAMQKEHNKCREESKRLSLELEKSKEETEKFLGNLKHELQDLERKIKDKEDGILASQMKIIQQEERLDEIVMGFERVRSGKGGQVKEHMPSAEDILAHIQGQGQQAPIGMSGGGGYTGGSSFSFVGGGSSTPSSAQSGGDGFKIPDAFMASTGGGGGGASGDGQSPFSRGRMWQGMGGNGVSGGIGSATFDLGDDDEDTMGSMGRTPGGRRSVAGRSGGAVVPGVASGGGGGFRRSATMMDYSASEGGPSGTGSNMMDVDKFNPWS